jgi:hypothetical protein
MKPKIGDLFEIRTNKGLNYALYTHQHSEPPKFGALIRVFDATYQVRPTDLEAITSGKVRFSTFFPLSAAVARDLVAIVGHVQVPAHLSAFPTFRSGTPDPATGRVANWWLWDGKESKRVGALTDEQRRLPIRAVWNDTFLRERLESGWTPEGDPW